MERDENTEELEKALCSQHTALEFFNSLAPGARPVIELVEHASKEVVECAETKIKEEKRSFFQKFKRKKVK